MLFATVEGVVAASYGTGEAAGRREDEAAVLNRPAEAVIEIQLRPFVVAFIDLAVGSEHGGTAFDAVEVS